MALQLQSAQVRPSTLAVGSSRSLYSSFDAVALAGLTDALAAKRELVNSDGVQVCYRTRRAMKFSHLVALITLLGRQMGEITEAESTGFQEDCCGDGLLTACVRSFGVRAGRRDVSRLLLHIVLSIFVREGFCIVSFGALNQL